MINVRDEVSDVGHMVVPSIGQAIASSTSSAAPSATERSGNGRTLGSPSQHRAHRPVWCRGPMSCQCLEVQRYNMLFGVPRF